MDETMFRQKLIDWGISPKDTILPTTAEYKLYGEERKRKIIPKEHESLIYTNIKDLEISDELYEKLSKGMGMTDPQVLGFIHKTYIMHLKELRKRVINLQKDWSRNFAHFRAHQVISNLNYDNIYHICDLVNQRLVPIELVLKIIFNIDSKYGDHRRIKDKTEIFVDARVLRIYNDKKSEEQRLLVGTQNN